MREYLKFYIDGQWVDPVELKTLDVDNPATEQVSGTDRARQSPPTSTRRSRPPARPSPPGRRRSREERLDVLQATSWPNTRSAPPTWPTPSPRRWARPPSLAAGPQVDARPRPPGHRHRRAEELRVRGAARRHADRQGADRRLRADHAVELADQPDRVQGVPGAGHRLHHGAQAVGGGAVLRADLHRDHRRRRRSRRRLQPGPRRRPRRRRGAVQPSRHRHGLVHRIRPAPASRWPRTRRRRSSG